MTTDQSPYLIHAAIESKPQVVEISGAEIRADLIAKREIAVLDVGSEAIFALSHPLFAANLPVGRIEVEVLDRIPRRDTLVVIYDHGEGYAEQAIAKLARLGYSNLRLLEGGLAGWQAGGGELFSDVNSASKAFGELVEHERHTPSLSAEQVQALIDQNADILIVDVRRYDEYHTMNIPSSRSLPGGEAVLRIQGQLTSPTTQVIVNCAGRTRSIIGTQSLINAGIHNPVAALRNGTIGWTLAGQSLEHEQSRQVPLHSDIHAQPETVDRVAALAEQAGVQWITWQTLERFKHELERTTYYFDVRDPSEYILGHIPGFISAPGGQLVQETDHFAPVRGARIVLTDTDGVRANITASWLAQMGWEVHVWANVPLEYLSEQGAVRQTIPSELVHDFTPAVHTITAAQVLAERKDIATVILDLETSSRYRKQHISNAYFIQRSSLAYAEHPKLPVADRYVLTSSDGWLAYFAAAETPTLNGKPVFALTGGNAAWAQGEALVSHTPQFIDPPDDVYRRPYEGTDNPHEAMQAYLDWEYGLVAQLAIDGTHGFTVI